VQEVANPIIWAQIPPQAAESATNNTGGFHLGHFNSRNLRARAAGQVCVIGACGLLAPLAASADDTQPAPGQQAEAIDEVVVTGIRAGLRNSLEFKRDSTQIVDSISYAWGVSYEHLGKCVWFHPAPESPRSEASCNWRTTQS